MVDSLLQMTHQQQIPGVEPIVVKCIMVHVTQNGTGTQPTRAVVGVNIFTKFVHNLY